MSRHTSSLLAITLIALTPACLPRGGSGGGGGGSVIIDDDAGSGTDTGDCVPDCSGRTCGADPVCGTSCGACDGTCTVDGFCDQSMGEGAPQFVSLTTNVTVMNPGDALVISAVVTDPDGVTDLLGGQLFDGLGQASYGAFSSSTPGSYEISLTWDQLRTVEEIEAPSGGTARTLRATFFDQQGSSSSRDLNIQLQCDAAPNGICSGTCVDFQNDPDNCGTCGNTDPNGDLPCVDGRLECPGGGTLCDGECTDLLTDGFNCGTCGNADFNGDRDCVNGQLVCIDEGFTFCEEFCQPPSAFEENANNCGSCGNDCVGASSNVTDLLDVGCFDSSCYMFVGEADNPSDCDTVCSQRGLRCDDSIEGISCTGAAPTKGCAVFEGRDTGCEVVVDQASCSSAFATPTATQIMDQCGAPDGNVEFTQIVCDCTN